jgi:hypothetical protein
MKRLRALALSAAILFPAVSAADEFFDAPGGWTTYVNDRFGIRLDFPPDVFEPEPPPENGDGRGFRGENAALQVLGFHNVDGDTPQSIKSRLADAEGYEDVTYSPSGDSWLVISGFRGDRIFYEKYFFSGGIVSVLGLEFPAEEKPFFAPLIERMEDSFEPGESD